MTVKEDNPKIYILSLKLVIKLLFLGTIHRLVREHNNCMNTPSSQTLFSFNNIHLKTTMRQAGHVDRMTEV
jgi:hypothetical protein